MKGINAGYIANRLLIAVAAVVGVTFSSQANASSYTYSMNGIDGLHPIATAAHAVSAPEIDPASLGSALTLLLGVLAVLRGRRPGTAD
jgi:hypothetical protein